MAELYDKNLISERIIQNQKNFINKFEKSLLGRFYMLGWKISGKVNYKTISRDIYIEKINCLKLRNRFIWVRYKLKKLKWHLKNKNKIDRNIIKKITDGCKDYISIACIIKNEACYMKEWLDFHMLAGVERFYIFDNDSTDNIKEILQPYIDKGIVKYFYYRGQAVQVAAYNDAIHICKGKTKWLAFIDADEFLFSLNGSLHDFFKEYEEYPAVGVNWVVYGPNGHVTKPTGKVTESYTQTFLDRNNELNCRIKSVLQPEKTLCMYDPHSGVYKSGMLCVDENKCVIKGDAMYAVNGLACTMNNSTEKIRINHYWTKSLEELTKKTQKGMADRAGKRKYEDMLKRLDYPMTEDKSICYIWNGLR